jgi:hypothetical protein
MKKNKWKRKEGGKKSLAYRISLISRICFTNYRNFKSSLLPLNV